MAEHHINLPISEAEARRFKVGDVVYITGVIVTARDRAHEKALRIYDEGKPLPLNMEDLAVFHCGPLVKKVDGEWIVVSAGPTTSVRMEEYEAKFIKLYKPRIIIGKGGMGPKTLEALKTFGAFYCSFTGGAGALAAKKVRRVKGVEWLDLGIVEALWSLEVKDFGPCIVAMDSYGGNLYSRKPFSRTKNIINALTSKNLKVKRLPRIGSRLKDFVGGCEE